MLNPIAATPLFDDRQTSISDFELEVFKSKVRTTKGLTINNPLLMRALSTKVDLSRVWPIDIISSGDRNNSAKGPIRGDADTLFVTPAPHYVNSVGEPIPLPPHFERYRVELFYQDNQTDTLRETIHAQIHALDLDLPHKSKTFILQEEIKNNHDLEWFILINTLDGSFK